VTSRLNPYISFKGNARQAIEFYQSVFGGDLRISTFGEFGSDDSASKDQIMHAMLETPSGYTIMASDTPANMAVTPGDNITISLSGEDESELRGYWDKLSVSGKVSMPLEKQAWGDVFGSCSDQFGINWMVNITQPQG
jgi:PhnB protein